MHLYPNATLVEYETSRQWLSVYQSTFILKTFSSIACNMTLINDKCAMGWTTLSLGRILVNLNLTLIEPESHI